MNEEKNEKQQKTKDNKKLKIALVILISAALVIGVVVAAFHFINKIPKTSTQYGSLKSVTINSENSFTAVLSAPYSTKSIEYVSDPSQKCILQNNESKQQFEAVVGEIKYSSHRSDEIQSGKVEVTFEIKNDFAFEDKTAYIFEMPDKTVTEKQTGISVGAFKTMFTAEETIKGSFSAKQEMVVDYELKETKLSRVSFENRDNKYYLVLTLNEDEIVNLNEQGLKEKQTGITYSYKNDSIRLVTVCDDITSSFDKDAGTVTVECPMENDDVIAGTEYVVYVSKGLLLNGDATLGSSEMTETFTYMG